MKANRIIIETNKITTVIIMTGQITTSLIMRRIIEHQMRRDNGGRYDHFIRECFLAEKSLNRIKSRTMYILSILLFLSYN